jgi:hypothetical protein
MAASRTGIAGPGGLPLIWRGADGSNKEKPVEQSSIVILSPVSVPKTKKLALRPRPKRLAGLRVAVVDNTKPNFNIFMDRIQDLLIGRYQVASVSRYVKPGRTVPVAHSVVAEIKANCDFAIAGLGD